MPWTIYKHTHIASGRCYVGLTKLDAAKRWALHVSAANGESFKRGKGCRHFHAAIKAYGVDAFRMDVLEEGIPTLEAANAAEVKWIAEFDSTTHSRGFNLDPGGNSNGSSPEACRLKSEKSLAMWRSISPEERARRIARLHKWRDGLAPEQLEAHMQKMRESAQRRFDSASAEELADMRARAGQKKRQRWAAMTPEQKKANGDAKRAGWAARTEEQRASHRQTRAAIQESANAKHRATCAARRANIAAACPAPSLRFNLLAPRVQPAAVAPAVPAVLPAPPVLPEPSRPLVQLPLFAA